MTITDILKTTRGELVTPEHIVNAATDAYTSDMLSDVMAHAKENSVLVTIQNHANTIAVCTLVGITIVLICHDRDIPDDMLAAAERENIAIVKTPLSQFEASAKIWQFLSAHGYATF